MSEPTPERPVQVVVTIDVHPTQARNLNDLVEAIYARLYDEAGYLANGDPIVPMEVRLAVTRRPRE